MKTQLTNSAAERRKLNTQLDTVKQNLASTIAANALKPVEMHNFLVESFDTINHLQRNLIVLKNYDSLQNDHANYIWYWYPDNRTNSKDFDLQGTFDDTIKIGLLVNLAASPTASAIRAVKADLDYLKKSRAQTVYYMLYSPELEKLASSITCKFLNTKQNIYVLHESFYLC